MPRYFFQITDGELVPDVEGVELPDLAAARHAAADILADYSKGSRDQFWQDDHWRLEIVDQQGAILATLTVVTEVASSARTTIGHVKSGSC